MIPVWMLNPKIIGAVAIAAGLAAGGWIARGKLADAQLARLEASHAQAIAASEKAARDAAAQAQARERSLAEQLEVIADEKRQSDEAAARAAVAADTAARGLRDSFAVAVRRCSSGSTPSAPGGGSAAIVPGSMSDGERLLRVLGELDGAAGAYADAADRSRAAGIACERAYDAARAEVK